MIYLTCDIHHAKLKTGNQSHCDISEIETATLMSELLFKRNIKATYFISGQSFADEWGELSKFVNHDDIAIGGHNYNCFKPDIIHCNTEYFAPIAFLLSKYFKVPFTVSVAGTYGITLPKQYKIYSYSF